MITLKKHILIGLIFVISTTTFGQSLSFLNIPQDAVAMGVGGASLAMNTNAYAVLNNPASISHSENKSSIGFNYVLWQPTSAKNNLMGAAGYFKLGNKFGIGYSGNYLAYPSYQVADANGAILSDFSPSEYSISVGLSYSITKGLSIGATFKMIGSSMADIEFVPDYLNGSAFAADIALMYKFSGLKLALMGTNLGSKISYGITDAFRKYNLPAMIKAGAAYELELAEQHVLSPSIQLDYLVYQKEILLGSGIEYAFNNAFFVRGGYHYGSTINAIPSYTSVGIGLKLLDISLNAAYLFANHRSALTNTFSISLGLDF